MLLTKVELLISILLFPVLNSHPQTKNAFPLPKIDKFNVNNPLRLFNFLQNILCNLSINSQNHQCFSRSTNFSDNRRDTHVTYIHPLHTQDSAYLANHPWPVVIVTNQEMSFWNETGCKSVESHNSRYSL